MHIRHNLYQLLIAVDQLANALLGLLLVHEKSWADETLSSRCYRWHDAGKRSWPARVVDALFFWDRDGEKRHCEMSFESERNGRQLPPEARGD